ncbi:MAG: hypothetical protein LBF04_03170 [Prevotellaceae bacterium]|nr:hypothetical protein [Prevotellaceae bacterium]
MINNEKKTKKISRRDRMLVEISSQPKITCGAAAVFQVICRNPHVLHKEMLFLPSDAFLTECETTPPATRATCRLPCFFY